MSIPLAALWVPFWCAWLLSTVGPAVEQRDVRSPLETVRGSRLLLSALPPDAPINRPVLGYVAWQSPPELRMILGVPGAAVFSEPLALPEDVTRIRVAPSHSYLLLERSGQPIAVAVLNGLEVGTPVPIESALQSPDLFTFSPSAHCAVLVSTLAGRFQVVSGLPETPRIEQDIDLSALPAAPDSVTINDDASFALLSSPGTVYLLLPDGSTRAIISITGSASMAFLAGTGTAAVADQAGVLTLFPALPEALSSAFILPELKSIGAIGSTDDAQFVYVTDPDGQRIWTLQIQNGEVRTFDVPVRPARIDRLKSASGFLISSDSGQPGWVFFREGDDMRTVFVPAAGVPARSETAIGR